MSRRSDTSLATLLLVSRAVPSEESPLSASEFWKLVEVVNDPARLLETSDDELAGTVGPVLAARVHTLLDRATSLAFQVEDLEHHGIKTLSALDDDYPPRWRERLGAAAPPVIHCAGPPQLLVSGGIAIVGSRDIAPAGARIAQEAANAAARDMRVVISGGARGTDKLAMQAALQCDGRVVGVLADALTRTADDPEVRRAIADELLCLTTPYAPTAPFSAGNAMGRNKLVYALADLTFVVATDEDNGGTWAGATEALQKHYGRVAAWTGEGAGSGNAALIKRGAVPIASISDLLASAVSGACEPTTPAHEQLGWAL